MGSLFMSTPWVESSAADRSARCYNSRQQSLTAPHFRVIAIQLLSNITISAEGAAQPLTRGSLFHITEAYVPAEFPNQRSTR